MAIITSERPTGDAFWLVWNPAGRAPVFKHSSEASAVAEAERLAKLNQGQQFFILQAVAMLTVTNMRRVSLTPAEFDETPF
jgi:hypothetical protein